MNFEFAFAFVIAYLIGALPTANWIAGMVGIDLRNQGSGNPGANNAFRLGGAGLGASVLFAEMAKGAGATLLGGLIAGEHGMVAAGIGAVAGNLYNVFYQFKGGKGLGITAGVLLVAWPTALVPVLVVIGLAAWITHSSDGASIIAIVSLTVMAIIWNAAEWTTGWGVSEHRLLLVLSIAMGLLIAPKHRANVRFRRPHPA